MRYGIRKIAACVLALVGIVAMADAGQTKIFDYMYGGDGQRVCLRLPKEKTVQAVLYAHQNMTEEVLFRSPSFTHRMDSLGVAMVFVQSGSQNWDTSTGCQERFEASLTRWPRCRAIMR